MQLRNLKKSILELPRADAISIHLEVRKNRIDFSRSKRTRKATSVKKKKESRVMQEIKKDPEKIKALLRLLGEDV